MVAKRAHGATTMPDVSINKIIGAVISDSVHYLAGACFCSRNKDERKAAGQEPFPAQHTLRESPAQVGHQGCMSRVSLGRLPSVFAFWAHGLATFDLNRRRRFKFGIRSIAPIQGLTLLLCKGRFVVGS